MASIRSVKLVHQPTVSQLPVDWYASPAFYALEEEHLFPSAPQYIGHQLMVPNPGDFYTLGWMDDAKMLVNHAGKIELISNVCRHRQAIMLNGKGNADHIVCPLHRWTYNLNGELLGAPHFTKNPCLNLNHSSLTQWQGLLFDAKRNIAEELKSVGCQQHFDFTGYMLDRVMVEEYAFNWKTFIEVYLEDYHVGPFHPGLDRFVDCSRLDWQFGDNFSVQTVGFKQPSHTEQTLNKTGSSIYQHWQNQVAAYHGNKAPKYGAIWMVYYPFLMIEWYPQVLVVSHLIPRGVDACTNVVEFYYPEDIALFEREYIAAQQAAYEETAAEDKEICQRMHAGRKALFNQKINEHGPYQHPMETGLEHFHLWMRRQLAPHL